MEPWAPLPRPSPSRAPPPCRVLTLQRRWHSQLRPRRAPPRLRTLHRRDLPNQATKTKLSHWDPPNQTYITTVPYDLTHQIRPTSCWSTTMKSPRTITKAWEREREREREREKWKRREKIEESWEWDKRDVGNKKVIFMFSFVLQWAVIDNNSL